MVVLLQSQYKGQLEAASHDDPQVLMRWPGVDIPQPKTNK